MEDVYEQCKKCKKFKTSKCPNSYKCFATIFPDLRMKERWENRMSPIAFSNFEEDCMKWKKDKRATVQFIIKDPYETGMTGRMVDSITLMMDRKLKK